MKKKPDCSMARALRKSVWCSIVVKRDRQGDIDLCYTAADKAQLDGSGAVR